MNVSQDIHSISDDKFQMITESASAPCSSPTRNDDSVKAEKKLKSMIPKIFSSKKIGGESSEEDHPEENNHDLQNNITSPPIQTSVSENKYTKDRIDGFNLSSFSPAMAPTTIVQDIRIFVATWNVGGKTPKPTLNLEEFLQLEGASDIYVLGFQEIVPLSAGNVLVIEDNEPAARWLALISRALNKQYHEAMETPEESSSTHSKTSKDSKSNFFHKPSLKILSKNLRGDNHALKACNCGSKSSATNSASSFSHRPSQSTGEMLSVGEEISSPNELNYVLVASKQMVGIFLTIWVRKELVQHVGHLRITWLGRGIMGFLGNKGCISVSLTLHQTSFCFVCSHLASGEKEGDERRRNEDVAEMLKNTQFQKGSKYTCKKIPEKITDHERIIWLGDLNYRVSLSYEATRLLLEDNDWDALLEKDQLNMEREAGRVFSGWDEGKISFAPTYKYTHNSDSYAGETVKSKRKRRTPAWCDRILWHGNGIEQLSYIRGESRFSDHRPVCSVFAVEVEVEMKNQIAAQLRNGYLYKSFLQDIPERHSFHEF